MAKTRLYIVRHGKTMFNTLGRAQGWSDTPLTKAGERGICELGQGLKHLGLSFVAGFSSDSGRAIQTMEIIMREAGLTALPYQRDKRIREWCFGSLEGAYDGELFQGILPRTEALAGRSLQEVSYEEIATAICQVDTADWAEPWEVLKNRILTGFTDIARGIEQAGGGNALIVCHGMTISTLMWLIDDTQGKQFIDNGSVSVVGYDNGQLSVEAVGDMTYRTLGRTVLEQDDEKK